MASCVRNIHAKNNQNLTIDFKVTVENVGGPSFLRHCVGMQPAAYINSAFHPSGVNKSSISISGWD